MLISGLGAALGSLGFGYMFHIKSKKLYCAAFIGGVGGFVYSMMLELGQSNAVSLFVASIALSILCEVFARVLKCTVTTFLVCAIIPLVPGGALYYTMLEIVNNNNAQAMAMGIDTVIQACSIAFGCILVSSFTRVYVQIKNRVKEHA